MQMPATVTENFQWQNIILDNTLHNIIKFI